MKVALVNTYPHGGAGIACRRLETALQTQGVDTTLLSRDTHARKWPFYAERLSFLPYESDKSVRFSYSLANFGTDISQHPDIKSADIIHLHWVNQGFLSLKNIRALVRTGKPVFWTLHDMWAFTGGCHYSRGCTNFEQACGYCPYLSCPSDHDVSTRIWKRKQAILPPNIHYVTCSTWLGSEARRSGLLRNADIQSIPNPIDTAIFKPSEIPDRIALRQKMGIAQDAFLLLFVAMKVSEERKGFQYLSQSLEILRQQHPGQAFEVMVLGQSDPEAMARLPYPVHLLGMVKEAPELSKWYGLADVFIIPSLEDNLPNTVIESLACGTPVTGFDTGGIPEMVDHGQNGFVVPQKDSEQLAQSIFKLSQDKVIHSQFRIAARKKVVENYSMEIIGRRYVDAYLAVK